MHRLKGQGQPPAPLATDGRALKELLWCGGEGSAALRPDGSFQVRKTLRVAPPLRASDGSVWYRGVCLPLAASCTCARNTGYPSVDEAPALLHLHHLSLLGAERMGHINTLMCSWVCAGPSCGVLSAFRVQPRYIGLKASLLQGGWSAELLSCL